MISNIPIFYPRNLEYPVEALKGIFYLILSPNILEMEKVMNSKVLKENRNKTPMMTRLFDFLGSYVSEHRSVELKILDLLNVVHNNSY